MKASFFAAQAALTTMPSNVGKPFLPIEPEVAITLPLLLTFDSTGSQMKAASMSPRSQAAAISGGRMFITVTLLGSTPELLISAMSW